MWRLSLALLRMIRDPACPHLSFGFCSTVRGMHGGEEAKFVPHSPGAGPKSIFINEKNKHTFLKKCVFFSSKDVIENSIFVPLKNKNKITIILMMNVVRHLLTS